ncbi:MAG: SIR2 family protein [Bacteroidales bacterium]|nr:SIR2 family protein [Bacteroidales bacterium]
MKTIELIKKAYKSDKLIPFIGSGFSASVAPTWDDFIEKLFDELNLDEEEKTRLINKLSSDHLEATEYYIQKTENGKKDFLKYINRKLKFKIIKKNGVHYINGTKLEKHKLLFDKFSNRVIYTTNWDNLIEGTGNYIVYKKKSDIHIKGFSHKFDTGRLIKYHGSVSDNSEGKSITASKTDYWDRILYTENPFNILFRYHLLSNSFLFIGYSFRDTNVALEVYRISQYLKTIKKGDTKIFWAVTEYRDDPRIYVLNKHAEIIIYHLLSEKNEKKLKQLEEKIKKTCSKCLINIPIKHNSDNNKVCNICTDEKVKKQKEHLKYLKNKYREYGTLELLKSLGK